MKNKYFNLVYVLLIAIVIVLLRLFFISKSELKKQEQSNKLELIANGETKIVENNFDYLEYSTNGIHLPSSLTFEDPIGKYFTLKELVTNTPKIILYLEQTHCSACYSNILNLLQTKYPEVCKNDLIVISHFDNFRSIIVFFSEMHLKTKLFNLTDSLFKLPACSAEAPFLTLIDKNFVVHNCCLPLKGDSGKLEAFINAFMQGNVEYDEKSRHNQY